MEPRFGGVSARSLHQLESLPRMDATELLSRLQQVRRNGNGWTALCPAHDDHNPSLSIRLGANGKIHLNCFTGCEYRNILRAINMTDEDLFTASPPTKFMQAPTFSCADSAAFYYKAKYGYRGRWWTYRNAAGFEVARIGRFDMPEGKQIRPISLQEDGRWHLKGPPAPRPLFDLPGILTSGRVFVAEGEPCAEAISKLGLCGTTAMNGASAANMTDWSPLSGKLVTLLPDNDPPGKKHMATVESILRKLPKPPTEITTIELPDLGPGEDVVDFLVNHSEEELLLLLA